MIDETQPTPYCSKSDCGSENPGPYFFLKVTCRKKTLETICEGGDDDDDDDAISVNVSHRLCHDMT